MKTLLTLTATACVLAVGGCTQIPYGGEVAPSGAEALRCENGVAVVQGTESEPARCGPQIQPVS